MKTKRPASLKEKADSRGFLYRPWGITPPLAKEEKGLLLIEGAEDQPAVFPYVVITFGGRDVPAGRRTVRGARPFEKMV